MRAFSFPCQGGRTNSAFRESPSQGRKKLEGRCVISLHAERMEWRRMSKNALPGSGDEGSFFASPVANFSEDLLENPII